MKLSSLSNLLKEELSPKDFLSEFSKYHEDYEALTKVVGSSIDIIVIEDRKLQIGNYEITKLCTLFIEDKLSNSELSYIADAAQLCESISFSDECIEDVVAEFTDPEINGVFSKSRAQEIISNFT
ncbi:hypothetical protein [Colwellia piezophila]|uniref:hypothetical protein n=1 Tax=Colwellia piezophila TaxID=211668 RepID=UPI0003775663|nr:hypothetical protein [Colwellia piezophila]